MELLQLKYFCHAAQTQNFSKTAKAFMVPASDISQSVKRLEKELGISLFARTANRVTLNENGRVFYEKVLPALKLLEEAGNFVKTENRSTLKICISIHRRIVMEAIEQFQKKHPHCGFVVTHTTPGHFKDYDIIVSDTRLDCDYWDTVAGEERFVLAYNQDVFSFSSQCAASELVDKPFITMNNESSVFQNTMRFCETLGFSPVIALQSEDPFYVRKCVELGIGISFVPELSWQGMFSGSVRFMNIGNLTRRIHIYQNKNATGLAKEFNDFLTAYFRAQH